MLQTAINIKINKPVPVQPEPSARKGAAGAPVVNINTIPVNEQCSRSPVNINEQDWRPKQSQPSNGGRRPKADHPRAADITCRRSGGHDSRSVSRRSSACLRRERETQRDRQAAARSA